MALRARAVARFTDTLRATLAIVRVRHAVAPADGHHRVGADVGSRDAHTGRAARAGAAFAELAGGAIGVRRAGTARGCRIVAGGTNTPAVADDAADARLRERAGLHGALRDGAYARRPAGRRRAAAVADLRRLRLGRVHVVGVARRGTAPRCGARPGRREDHHECERENEKSARPEDVSRHRRALRRHSSPGAATRSIPETGEQELVDGQCRRVSRRRESSKLATAELAAGRRSGVRRRAAAAACDRTKEKRPGGSLRGVGNPRLALIEPHRGGRRALAAGVPLRHRRGVGLSAPRPATARCISSGGVRPSRARSRGRRPASRDSRRSRSRALSARRRPSLVR